MKDYLYVVSLLALLSGLILCGCRCWCMEKNQLTMLKQMNMYQEQHFKKEAELEKQIHVLQQDVLFLQEGNNEYK